MTPGAYGRGEAYLLGRPSLLTDGDVRRLPGLAALSLAELLQVPGLPPHIASPPGARGRYWHRRDIRAWWRRRHGIIA